MFSNVIRQNPNVCRFHFLRNIVWQTGKVRRYIYCYHLYLFWDDDSSRGEIQYPLNACPDQRIRHVLRNSMIPIVTLFGLDFGAVVGGGAILTETVFNINGVGLYAGQAIGKLDLPPLMAVTMFGAFFIVLFNTIVDLLYAVLDPRIRLGEAAPV